MAAAVPACSSAPAGDAFGVTASAVHGAARDTKFPAVGYLTTSHGGTNRECTATLIGPQLVLTAARCYAAFAQGCSSHSEAVRALGTFVLNPSGDESLGSSAPGRIAIDVDAVRIDPNAYGPKLSACSGSKHSCAEATTWPRGFGIHHSHDIAVVHLARRVKPTEVTPLRVVTNFVSPIGSADFQEKPSGAVHAKFVIDTLDNFNSIEPTLVGWGANDTLALAAFRGSATGKFRLNGSGTSTLQSVLSGCIPHADCNDNPIVCPAKVGCCGLDLAGPGGLGSALGLFDPDAVLHVKRTQVSLGSFVGPAIATPLAAPRDTGAPLIVSGVVGPGGSLGYPGLPAGDFVVGVASEGDSTGTGMLPESDDGFSFFSPTFSVKSKTPSGRCTPLGTPWLEARLVDFDCDNVIDRLDNCVTTPNGEDQSDTNFEAEIALSSPASDGHLPAPTDVEYVDQFHAQFPGDSCDRDATTRATNVPATNGETGTCPVTDGFSFVDKVSCDMSLNTGLVMDGWIGNTTSDASTGKGHSVPVFCRCDDVTDGDVRMPSSCKSGLANCIPGSDATLPKPYNAKTPAPSGWRPISEHHATFPFDAQFPRISTTHQEKTDELVASGAFVGTPTPTHIWNFRADADRSTFLLGPDPHVLSGVLWTSLDATSYVPGSDTSVPRINYPNHYLPLVGHADFATIFVSPLVTFTPLPWFWPDPPFVLDRNGPVTDPPRPDVDPWYTFAPTATSALPLHETPGGLRVDSRIFSDAALALIAPTLDPAQNLALLVADDLASIDAITRPTILSAVVFDLQADRTISALGYSHGQIVPIGLQQPQDPKPTPPPARLLRYDGVDARVYELTGPDSSGHFSLAIHDVRAEISGVGTATRSDVNGDAPTEPIAMIWNGVAQSLLVLDVTTEVGKSTKGGGKAEGNEVVRLLAIAPDGTSVELWRTRKHPFTETDFGDLAGARFSVAPWGDTVLTLELVPKGDDGKHDDKGKGKAPSRFAEVVILASDGTALSSTSVGEPGVVAPVFAFDSFLAVPRRKLVPSKDGSNLESSFVDRTALLGQSCGTTWLRKAAPDKLSPIACSTAKGGGEK